MKAFIEDGASETYVTIRKTIDEVISFISYLRFIHGRHFTFYNEFAHRHENIQTLIQNRINYINNTVIPDHEELLKKYRFKKWFLSEEVKKEIAMSQDTVDDNLDWLVELKQDYKNMEKYGAKINEILSQFKLPTSPVNPYQNK